MPTASVYAKGDAVHASDTDESPPHPGPWNERVYVVVSDQGVHWIGAHRGAALLVKLTIAGARLVPMETGTAYVEGR